MERGSPSFVTGELQVQTTTSYLPPHIHWRADNTNRWPGRRATGTPTWRRVQNGMAASGDNSAIWASLVAKLVKNLPTTWETCSIPGSGRSAGEGIGSPLQYSWASLVAQLVKNSLAVWETWVQSLGWETPLEKEKATHSSILAWRISWTV